MTGRRRATPQRGGRLRMLGQAFSPLPALAVQSTYILYSLNTLFTIAPGPVADDFDSRFDAPGGIPFHLPWALLVPSVVFAGAAVMDMVREEPSRIRRHRPFFLGFVWGLGAIYTYGYGIGFIALTPIGNGMLFVSGALALCSLVSMAVASVKLARHHVSTGGGREREGADVHQGESPRSDGRSPTEPSVESDEMVELSASRDES